MPTKLDGPEEYRGRQSGRFSVALGKKKKSVLAKVLDDNKDQFGAGYFKTGESPKDYTQTLIDKLSHKAYPL
jgi:hypothetical protein